MFYKEKRTVLNRKTLKDVTCPNCGTLGTIRIEIYRIAVWQRGGLPLGAGPEIDDAECLNCKVKFNSANMPPAIKVQANQLSARTETPYRYWFWLYIVVLAAIVGIVSHAITDSKTKSLLNNPQKGDLYEISIFPSRKIVRVIDSTRDSVLIEVTNGNFKNRIYDLTSTANESTFESPGWVSKERILQMYSHDEIVEIVRSNQSKYSL